MMNLEPLTARAAVAFMIEKGCRLEIDVYDDLIGIGVVDRGIRHGAILLKANGSEFSLVQLFTDNTALVGSILYGAAWRAAKALGYKTITI
jgi:hypothetical protein